MARFIPFGNQPIIATLKQLDPSLEEASENLGATFRHTIIRILLPLMKPGLIAAWALSFVLWVSLAQLSWCILQAWIHCRFCFLMSPIMGQIVYWQRFV
ncbi:ABC transporter permease subunit [bacterium]|nr:ABC transporter permease subunit [bacterium]